MAFKHLNIPGAIYEKSQGSYLVLAAWLLAALLLPSVHVFSGIAVHDEHRVILALLLAVTGLCFTARPGRRSPAVPHTVCMLLPGVAALGALSAALAPVPSYAYLEVAIFLLMIAGVSVIADQSREETHTRCVTLPVLGGAVVFYGLVALLVLAAAWTKGDALSWPEPVHTFLNLRFLNQWQSWMLPMLPALLYTTVPRCRPWLFRAFIFSFFGLFWALLFHSAGRGSLYSLIGSTLVIVMLFGRTGLRWAGIQMLAALLGLVLAVLILDMNIPGISDGLGRQERLVSTDSPGRLMLWMISGELMRESPWLGVGPMQFAVQQVTVAAHPHSFPVQIAVEWGIPAALLLGTAVFWMLFRWLTFARSRISAADCPDWERYYILSLTGSILTAGGHSLVSGTVVMPISQLMLVLVCGLALGWYRRNRIAESPLRGSWFSRTWQGLALCSVLWLLLFGGHELTHHRQNLVEGFIAAKGPAFQPRFWHQGKLIHHLSKPARVIPTGAGGVQSGN